MAVLAALCDKRHSSLVVASDCKVSEPRQGHAMVAVSMSSALLHAWPARPHINAVWWLRQVGAFPGVTLLCCCTCFSEGLLMIDNHTPNH